MESTLLEINGVEVGRWWGGQEKDQVTPPPHSNYMRDLVYLDVIGVLIRDLRSFNPDTVL